MKKIMVIYFVLCLFFVSGVFAQDPGDIIWSNSYGSNDTEYAYSVGLTTDGGYILGGQTNFFGAGGNDVYLVKIDAIGDTLWTRAYGGVDSDKCKSVQQCSDGGYIIAGETNSFGAGNYDVYLIKTDANGDTLWTRTFGGTGIDRAESVKEATDGGYIITGNTGSFGAGGKDVYLIKTDANGDTLWTKTFGAIDDEEGHSVQLTTDGGYIIAGFTESFGAGGRDVYLIKTDANGDTLWTSTHGGTNDDRGYSVQQCNDGSFVISGDTKSSGAGNSDFYLVKTDADGETLWSRSYGGSAIDIGYSLQQTTDEGYIIAGSTQSFNVGYFDIYMVKTDSVGDTLWTRTYGSYNYEHGRSVQLTTDGNYIVAGWTWTYGPGISAFWLLKIAGEGVSINPPENLYVDESTGYATWDVPLARDLLGYNVYLDSVFIDFTTDLFWQYTALVSGTTYMAGVTALYDEGESLIIEFEYVYNPTVYDPPENVQVDPYTGLVTWEPPGGAIFFDDFESYTVGEYLALQSDDWITWSGTVGGPDDVLVVDDLSYSGSNSIKIEGLDDDVVHLYGNLTTGVYELSHYQYFVPGYGGYFNLLHEFTGDRARTEWALEVYFASDGSGYINAGGLNAATFTYTQGAWVECWTLVDLDNDWAEVWIDGNFVHEWQWSLQFSGGAGMNMLGAIDIWAGAPAGDLVMYYVDDVKHALASTSDELTGYNVYLDGAFVYNTTELQYQYTGLVYNQTYLAGVSAVYDDPGESEIIEAQFTFLETPVLPPENLVATVVGFNDVLLEWEPPNLPDETRLLLGYNVYRDGDVIAYLDDPNLLTYDDLALDSGTYEYWVTAVYDEGESDPSNIGEVIIILYSPQNLTAIVQGINNVFLSWDAPATRAFDYYNIYRDGSQIATNINSTFYLDVGLAAGTYVYNVAAVYDGGWESELSNNTEVTVDAGDLPLPVVTELSGNYPNPFNPTTTISFSTTSLRQGYAGQAESTEVCIYNLKGQKVKTLINAIIPNGFHRTVWDGKDENGKPVSSGIYFYKMESGKYSSTRKMILMK